MTEKKAKTNPLCSIMNPKSVVVAGASSNIMKMGSIQALNLVYGGYPGEVMFLHPYEKEVIGKPAYQDPADLPIVPDLTLMVTPAKVTLDLLDKLGQKGLRFAVIVTAGFREIGGEGVELEEELVAIAKKHGIRFVGPNCIGVLNAHARLNMTVAPYLDKPGKLGLISQSGTYVAQTLAYLRDLGIRYSQAISVGNATNIDVVDCIEYLGDDVNTQCIAMYIEGIRRGREFIEAAGRVSRKKPIVALYVGGTESGSRSSMSHTGSMGGPDALYDGIFEQAGVIRVSTMEELFGWGYTLANMPVPKSNRVAILTHSGGPATSMADACEKAGLELPVFSEALQDRIKKLIEPMASAKNPVDLTFSLNHDHFTVRIPELLFHSDEVDGILIHGMMDTGFAIQMYENVKQFMAVPKEDFVKAMEFDLTRLMQLPLETGKPLVSSNFLREDHAAQTFRDNNIPLFFSPEHAVKAMAALVRYGKIRARHQGIPNLSGTEISESKEALPDGVMDEFKAKKLLAEYGVPVAKELKVAALDEAWAAAEKIGYPIALKGLPAGIAHKTEAGLVHLRIKSKDELEAAWRKIEDVAPGCPKLVAEMLKGEREFVVGMTRFPGFGPCVMLGIGGVFTEAIKDITFRVAPVAFEDALTMPDSLRLRKLLAKQRGMPEVDRPSLAKTIQAVGRLALEHPEVTEIDINPLIAVDGIPIAADALVVVSPKHFP